MMSTLRKLVYACVPLYMITLSGCDTVQKVSEIGAIDYKSESKQRQLPPLEIPPDLRAPGRDDRFAVPGATGATTLSEFNASRGTATKTSGSDVLPKVTNARLERAGSQRWLVVQASPDALWPVVKEFWQENGFLINVDQPDSGVMETVWAENRAKLPMDFVRNTLGKVLDQVFSTGERDKFRTRMERGSQPDTTEIYISHRGLLEVVNTQGGSSTLWQGRPSDPELEAEFLTRLMAHLGVEGTRARTLVTAETKVPDKAKITRSADGSSVVDVLEPFDRAWRRVGLALDRVGFTVEDRDRSKGFYFVRYVDPDADAASKKNDGFLSKLAFWRSNSAPIKTEQYRIVVKDNKDTSQVQVFTKDGTVESSDTTRRILSLLHEQLK